MTTMSEHYARVAKSAALAAVLRCIGCTAKMVRHLNASQWQSAATAAGVEPPHSKETKDMVTFALTWDLTDPPVVVEHKAGTLAIRKASCLLAAPVFFVELSDGKWPPQDEIIEACTLQFATARMLFVGENQAVVLASLPKGVPYE